MSLPPFVKPLLLSLLCLGPGGCRTAHVIDHAPLAEAERFVFPTELPLEGLLRVDGNTAAAIQLATEHFLPWDAPPSGRTACLDRRDSYDVTAAPGPEGVVLVQFVANDQRCPPDPTRSVEATTGKPLQEVVLYAVDLRTQRLLSVGRRFLRQR